MIGTALRLGMRDRAEDVVQEAMIKLIDAQVDPSQSPRSYAMRTTWNVALDFLRRDRRRPSVSLEELVGPDGDVAGQSEEIELRMDVHRAVCSLPELQGEAIRMYADGSSYEEIAAHQGTTAGTVRSRIHRGRKILAPLLRAA